MDLVSLWYRMQPLFDLMGTTLTVFVLVGCTVTGMFFLIRRFWKSLLCLGLVLVILYIYHIMPVMY